MAVGPAGGATWSTINPALAKALRLPGEEKGPFNFADPLDTSRVVAADGSLLIVDWTVHEEGSLAFWVGRERTVQRTRELHHRLKNTLQIMVSLLGFQASRLSDPRIQEEFARAEARVLAVARLHEPAYASRDFSQVEFGQYLQQLVHGLASKDAPRVRLITDEVAIPMDDAVPLAVIANELIANALENSRSDTVRVQLRYEPAKKLSLTVSDGGIGFDAVEPGGALELIDLFVDQLQGTLQTRSADGPDVSVTFQLRDE